MYIYTRKTTNTRIYYAHSHVHLQRECMHAHRNAIDSPYESSFVPCRWHNIQRKIIADSLFLSREQKVSWKCLVTVFTIFYARNGHRFFRRSILKMIGK